MIPRRHPFAQQRYPPLDSALLPVTRSRLLSDHPGVIHGITHRVPGLGLADGNLGYGPPRDTADAWQMRRQWSSAIGVDPDRLVAAGQVHGADVLRVRRDHAGVGARPDSRRVGIADALITDEPGVALLSLHADCLPLLLVDPQRPAIAAVHAGWRGTVANIASAAVAAMSAQFGSRPDQLLAFLGPAIGACCYEVGPDVITAWQARAGAAASLSLTATGPRRTFDLHAANTLLLTRAGLLSQHIEHSPICTRCAGEDSFSHRGQGANTGRFGAIISLAG